MSSADWVRLVLLVLVPVFLALVWPAMGEDTYGQVS